MESGGREKKKNKKLHPAFYIESFSFKLVFLRVGAGFDFVEVSSFFGVHFSKL